MRHDGFQCGYCTPGRSARRSACSPSTAAGAQRRHRARRRPGAADPGGDPGADERQPVPLRRLQRHRRRDRARSARCREALRLRRARRTSTRRSRRSRERPGARFLGGGTNLVDLMRRGHRAPGHDWSTSPGCRWTRSSRRPAAGCGSAPSCATADLAAHPLVRTRYPVLSQALLSGASGQLRNMATVGGNLLQRTRCLYFYDGAAACNKREPGAGCARDRRVQPERAVLGTSEHCIAAHPSDMCVALAALDADRRGATASRGVRAVPARASCTGCPATPRTSRPSLAPDELITAVELPAVPVAGELALPQGARPCLVRVRAGLGGRGAAGRRTGRSEVRLALGGVAPTPWRAQAAEQALLGGAGHRRGVPRAAAAAELAARHRRPENEFKIELARADDRRDAAPAA